MITLTAESLRRLVACLAGGSVLFLSSGCGSETEDEGDNSSTRTDVSRPSAGDTSRPEADAGVADAEQDASDEDGIGPGGDAVVDAEADAATDAGVPDDSAIDRPDRPTPNYDPNCDLDGDGVMTIGCTVGTTVGTDCDDRDSSVNPDRPEVCDSVDNNCDGQINEGIECAIFAHTSSSVYRVNIFQDGSEPELIDGDAPGILDFDTAPDGTLYGVNVSGLVRFDSSTSTWQRIGSFSLAGANGFAALTQQIGYITAGTRVYEVNLESGDATLLGEMGGDFSSSGDCVINKDGTLFMSSRGNGGDRLVSIALSGPDAGRATLIGTMTGVSNAYGLTSAYGQLYAFNSFGRVYRVDPTTAAAEQIADFGQRYAWYGAASTPAR